MNINTVFDIFEKVYLRNWNAKADEPQYMKGEILRINICGNSAGGYEIMYHIGVFDGETEEWHYADVWEQDLLETQKRAGFDE